jgi:glycosyltransferase involved in cell wall biosynthesis
MKKKLLYVSPIMSRSGYGDHAREFAQYLTTKNDEYDIRMVATPWGSNPQTGLIDNPPLNKKLSEYFIKNDDSFEGCDVYIQLGLPPEFKAIGQFNIGITAGVETDIVGSSFIDGVNKMDLLIVPSQFTKETFLNSSYSNKQGRVIKIETPIEVIHEYADDTFYKDEAINLGTISELNQIKEDFCFLFVGQWVSSHTDDGGRKIVNSLIESFLNAFSDEKDKPALILKTSGTNFSISDYIDTENRIKEILTEHTSKDLPSIYLLHGNFSSTELYQLYNNPKIKAFVTHTRGEGFGRPILEASLSGIPVLATKWSGHLDIIDKKNSILLPGQLHEVGIDNSIFTKESKWMTVDGEYSSSKMKEVFREYEKYSNKAVKLKEINLEKFSPSKIHDDCDKVFEKYLSELPAFEDIELPELDI